METRCQNVQIRGVHENGTWSRAVLNLLRGSAPELAHDDADEESYLPNTPASADVGGQKGMQIYNLTSFVKV